MNELEIGFRTAMVGGFQRDDVLKYIEEMAQGHAKETEALKSKLDEIETERDALKKRIKGLTDEKNSLRQRLDQQEQELGQAKAKLETQKQELEQAKSDTDAHAGQYHDLQQQLGALQVEAGELRLQNDSLQEKVREYDDSMYLLCANKEYLVNMVVFNYGKQLLGKTFFDADTKTLNLTEDDLKTVYEYVKQLYDEEVVAPASYQASYTGDNLQSDTNWIAGKYVAAPTYISTIDVMVAANPEANYMMGQLPVLDGATEKGWASNTPQVIAITKTCEHPEAAVEFMNYFYNDDTALETLGATRSVPPTEKARKICSDKGILSEITMEGADIAAAMGGTPNDKISSSQESKTILFDSVETIGYGASTPEEAAADTINLLSGLEQ